MHQVKGTQVKDSLQKEATVTVETELVLNSEEPGTQLIRLGASMAMYL